MLSKLPKEIQYLTFQYLYRHELARLSRTSRTFYAISNRILYRSVIGLAPVRAIAFFKSLHQHTSNFPLVCYLDLDWSNCDLTHNFYRLLNNTLRRLTSLVSLSLELPRHHRIDSEAVSWVLNGCSFSLHFLSMSIPCDTHLTRFLQAQSNIRELCLRGLTRHCVLPPSSLPKLSQFRSVNTHPFVLAGIISGRPVEAVSISLRERDALGCLDALCLSSVPMRRLSLMTFDIPSPYLLFGEVARRMPDLQVLNILVVHSGSNLVSDHRLHFLFSHPHFFTIQATSSRRRFVVVHVQVIAICLFHGSWNTSQQ
jgi:hypothetical protein